MSPISNDKLLKLITDLTNKVNSLTDIVKYQTNLIQELKADNTQITNLINTEFKNNKDTLGELPIKQLTRSLNKLDNENNNNILILTNLNKCDNLDYQNKDNLINFINSKLDYELNKESIVNINKFNNNSHKNKDTSDNTQTDDKYFIKFTNHDIVIEILKNKLKLKGSKYYINIKNSIETDNILYSTRKLVKSKKIFKTWVYKNKVYINIDDNNDNIYISDTSQLNNLV